MLIDEEGKNEVIEESRKHVYIYEVIYELSGNRLSVTLAVII